MPIDPSAFIRVPLKFALNPELFDLYRLGPDALRLVLTVALGLCAAHLVVSLVARVLRPKG